MAAECAIDLKEHNIAFISLWPGAVRTEHINNMIDELKASGDHGNEAPAAGLVQVNYVIVPIKANGTCWPILHICYWNGINTMQT